MANAPTLAGQSLPAHVPLQAAAKTHRRRRGVDCRPCAVLMNHATGIRVFEIVEKLARYLHAFATHMQGLAMATDGGSVTVLSHPSLQGISSGSGLSGSTGWRNLASSH